MGCQLFISDLHLSPKYPRLTEIFANFLAQQAKDAEALYILGDFFDLWLGDDCIDDWSLSIAKALRKLSAAGTKVYLMVGNRDFLLSQGFARLAGCQLLDDPSLITLQGRTLLLKHGDDLCTLDKSHQSFRRVSRSRWGRGLFLALPKRWRLSVAAKIRANSERGKKQKTRALMDVVDSAIRAQFEQYDCDILLHGHIHRASIRKLKTAAGDKCHMVLADWRNGPSYLKVDSNGAYMLYDNGVLSDTFEKKA